MPPIEELRKKVDEDWDSGKIGPPNTDGFDEEGRHVEEGEERCMNQIVAARLHAIDATPARRRGGGVSHRHPTHWSISTQVRRARRTSPRASPKTSPRAPSNTFLGLKRERERAGGRFFFFFVATGVLKSRQARLLLAGLLLGRSPAVVELAAHPALHEHF